jgi:hypothetical protein
MNKNPLCFLCLLIPFCILMSSCRKDASEIKGSSMVRIIAKRIMEIKSGLLKYRAILAQKRSLITKMAW